jgi:hypothetical protein
MGSKNTALKGIMAKGMEGTEGCYCPTCGTSLIYIDSIKDLAHRSWAKERYKERMDNLKVIKKEHPNLIFKQKQ